MWSTVALTLLLTPLSPSMTSSSALPLLVFDMPSLYHAPVPPTLRDIAEQMEAAARRLHAEGKHEAASELYKAAADARKAVEALLRLPEGEYERIVRSMNVDTTRHASDVKRGATRARRKHPAQRIFYEKGVTITSVAKEIGETRARVSSWMADGDALRPIPPHQAEKLRLKYGVPLSVWKRIAG